MKKRKEHYDVFISYRREDGWQSAKHLRDILVAKGYSVFFDINSLKSGNFNDAILDYIKNCKDFIIILSPRSLDRCVNKDDWVRKELAHALKEKKNVIPVMYNNFSFPDVLPEDIEGIRHINGIHVYMEVFDAIVEKIISFMESHHRGCSCHTRCRRCAGRLFHLGRSGKQGNGSAPTNGISCASDH